MSTILDSYEKDIVPMPEGTEIFGKKVIGVMACKCGDAMTVRPDCKGRPEAYCDKHMTVQRCGRSHRFLKEDIPAQTLESFESYDISKLPTVYQAALNKAWQKLETSEVSKQNQEGVENDSKTGQSEKAENSGKSGAENSKKVKRVRGLI